MRRGATELQPPGRLPVTPGVGLLLVLMGGLTAWVLWRAGQADPALAPSAVTVPASALAPSAPAAGNRSAGAEAPAPALPAQPAWARAADLSDHQQPVRAAPQPGSLPYRFMGHAASGSASSGLAVVLFGRGRVVTLQGPATLDDEYAVEALFDDYLVLRHLPSGRGYFLALSLQHTPGGPAQDPEQSARD